MNRQNLRDLFSFSKSERNGLLVLCILILLVALVPYVYKALQKPKPMDASEFKTEIETYRNEMAAAELRDSLLLQQQYGNLYIQPKGLDYLTLLAIVGNPTVADSIQQDGITAFQLTDLSDYPVDADSILNVWQTAWDVGGAKKEEVKQVTTWMNGASKESWGTLKGIGPTTAEAIVLLSSQRAFQSPDELMLVDGIGESKYISIREQIVNLIEQAP